MSTLFELEEYKKTHIHVNRKKSHSKKPLGFFIVYLFPVWRNQFVTKKNVNYRSRHTIYICMMAINYHLTSRRNSIAIITWLNHVIINICFFRCNCIKVDWKPNVSSNSLGTVCFFFYSLHDHFVININNNRINKFFIWFLFCLSYLMMFSPRWC